LQIAERRAPTTNDQELPKILRNLCNEIAMRQFAVLQNAISRNKRTHQNADLQDEGAAVLAPHGAFRSAGPWPVPGRHGRVQDPGSNMGDFGLLQPQATPPTPPAPGLILLKLA